MAKLISSLFTNSGSPVTGLSPTIRIWEVTATTNNLVVTDDAMVEVGDGFYKYDFTTYDPTLEYLFRTDGGVTLSSGERFQRGSNRNSASEVWQQQTTDFIDAGTFGLQSNTTAADAAATRIDVTTALAVLDVLLKYETNRTRVDPIAGTLTIFDDDETTPLQVFDLRDESGNIITSLDCIFERDPQ